MKKRKLVLALMLSLMMLVTMIPSFSFADGTGGAASSAGSGTISAATSGNCGATGNDHVTWKLTQNNSGAANPTYTLTIDGSGAMADYKNPNGDVTLAAPWYQTLSADAATKLFPITNIEIGDKVTGLGDYAFAYTEIAAIGFEKNVTDYGDNLYSHCSKVEVVDWAGFNPKNISDGYVTEQTATGSFVPFGMFDYCEKLDQCKNGATTYPAGKLVFPENITGVMTAAFRGTGFSSIDFESSNLTRAGAYVFSYMPNLTELTVPGKVEFYQQNGDLQSSAFQGCAALEKVTLDDSVTIIPYRMFSQCSKLAEVQADKADSKLETIDRNAFAQCGKLASFTFPDALKNLRNSAFIQTGLTSVELGAVETLDNNVFQGCSALTTVNIEGTKDLKLPGSLFNGSWNNSTHGFDNDGAKLTSFTVENGDLSDFSLSGSKTTLKNVVLGDGVTNVPNGLLSGFEVLETVSLGKGVTSIADNTFKECTSLKSIELSEGLTSIGNHAFNGCTSLAAVHLEKATALKTLGRSAFAGCTALTGIVIPDAVTEIGSSAFDGCSNLTKVDISPNSKLTTIGGGAFVNSEVPYFYIPSGVTVGQQAFFFNAEPTNKKITYDLSGWDTKNLNTSVFGKWCFSQYWDHTNYREIARTFYLPDDTVVPYLPVGTSSIYTAVDPSDKADRTRNAVYAVTNGGTFAKNTDFTADTLATPIKKNNRFEGWYDNAKCSGEAVQKPKVNETYYAKWEKSAYSMNGTLDLGELTYGDTPKSGDFTVTAEKVESPSVTKVEGSDSFTANVDGTDPMKVVVTPKENLSVGNYEETIVVTTGDGVMHDVIVTLVVKKRDSQTEDQGSVTTVTYGDKMNLSVSVGEAAAISTLSLDDEKEALNEVGFYYGDRLLGKAEVQYTDNGGTAAYEYDTTRGIIPTGSEQTVTAKYGGSDTLKESKTDIKVLIKKADQAIAYGDKDVTKHINDGAFTNPLTQTTVHGKLTYTSSDNNVATVNEKGEVTIKGAGTATITATAEATDNYNEATDSYRLTVHQFSDKWSFNADGHWHACTVDGCDVKADSAAHEFQWVVDKEATTTEKGSKHEKCTVCGYEKKAVEIPVIENGTTGGDQNNGNAGNGTKADAANGSKTGDTMPIGMLAVLMLAAAAGIAFCGRKLYKSR